MNPRVNTPGSARGAGEPIVDIVPVDAPLQIEVRLSLDVAADVQPGIAAERKLMTADARYERLMTAQVIEVSADALTDERSGAPFLRALLQAMPDAAAGHRAALDKLRPGMAAEVYIKTTERTPIGFLLEPISGCFRRALRER